MFVQGIGDKAKRVDQDGTAVLLICVKYTAVCVYSGKEHEWISGPN